MRVVLDKLSMQDNALRTLIRARSIARNERERLQPSLIVDDEIFRQTIKAKLSGINDSNQYWNFCRCGEEDLYRTCKECGTVEKFPYRCNLKWCPACQWKIVEKRKDLLTLWSRRIRQPKHMVLTQRNFRMLTRSKLRAHTKALASLRRRKVFERVKGGCVSVEITNEGDGWHLHSHWLLDARWLDMDSVSRVWGKLVGQEFAIVKIKDVRNADYVQEVSKYVVEGSELAKWPAELIHEFVTAVRGTRFFTTFGSLRELSPQIRAEIFAAKPERKICDCGCGEFLYEDQTTTILNEIRSMQRKRR
jgi:hypothetical protein